MVQLLNIQSTAYSTVQNNIIPYHDMIVTARGWYPIETFGGETFRWVANDAEIIVSAPSGRHSTVAVEIESGPSLGRIDFLLEVHDIRKEVVASAGVINRQTVTFDLPINYNETAFFRLHVNSDNLAVPGESRLMNFRVFSLGWAHLLNK